MQVGIREDIPGVIEQKRRFRGRDTGRSALLERSLQDVEAYLRSGLDAPGFEQAVRVGQTVARLQLILRLEERDCALPGPCCGVEQRRASLQFLLSGHQGDRAVKLSHCTGALMGHAHGMRLCLLHVAHSNEFAPDAVHLTAAGEEHR